MIDPYFIEDSVGMVLAGLEGYIKGALEATDFYEETIPKDRVVNFLTVIQGKTDALRTLVDKEK